MQRMLCSTGITTPFEFEREVAYSRESNHPKQYVQNLLTRDAAKIYDYWIRFTTFQHLLSALFIIFCSSGKEVMSTSVERSVWLRE